MKTNPTVCAVMLVNGREEMVRRAIKAFFAQTYEQRRLLVWDTGETRLGLRRTMTAIESRMLQWPEVDREHFKGASIGTLRNAANKYALAHYTTSDTRAEVLMHWDSDDLSHPQRIAEQVALLVDSGKECVGYNEMLFWRQRFGLDPKCGKEHIIEHDPGEAWLYRNVRHDYAVGTSLCYWRDAWERHPFEDLPKKPGGTGEDTQWLRGVRCGGVSSIGYSKEVVRTATAQVICADIKPRMIASIHGGNSMPYDLETLESPSWQRVPQWDEHCRATMAL